MGIHKVYKQKRLYIIVKIARGYMRKLLLLALLIILPIFSFAVDSTIIGGDLSSPNYSNNAEFKFTLQEYMELRNRIDNINSHVNALQTTEENNTNFQQLDETLNQKIADSTNTQLALIAGLLILNNLCLFGAFGLLKGKGLI